MATQSCRHFNTCSSPICPEVSVSIKCATWFPADEICHRHEYAELPWVGRQRRIALLTKGKTEAGFFTYRMLSHRFQIKRGIQGIVFEAGDRTEAEERWLKQHPGLRNPSPEQREEARARIMRLRPWESRRRKPVPSDVETAKVFWYTPAALTVVLRPSDGSPVPNPSIRRWLFDAMTPGRAG
jgi:hypothetical protein